MAKKGPLNDLYELIPEYGEIKAHYDILKKQESEKNRLIKSLMSQLGLDKQEVNGYRVEYSTRESDTYDEEAILEYMHKHKEFAPCIKVKEYFDVDVLEDLMYKGEIPKKLQIGLDKFRTTKVTEVLKVKKV